MLGSTARAPFIGSAEKKVIVSGLLLGAAMELFMCKTGFCMCYIYVYKYMYTYACVSLHVLVYMCMCIYIFVRVCMC